METVVEFMHENIPSEHFERFKKEFFKWAPGETTVQGVFYNTDVLWMLVDHAGIPLENKRG